MDSNRELTLDLSATQALVYEALEDVTDDIGQFGQDAGPHGAHYMDASPFADKGVVCSNCAFYAGPRACEIVSGDIAPEGICKFWIIPERLMAESPETATGRPYPNEHAARLKDPAQYDRLRRRNDAGGKGVDFIFGIKTGQPVELQAVRFRSAQFTAAEARKWLSDRDYSPIEFEEATGDRRLVENVSRQMEAGDFVEWDSSGGMARGRIDRIVTEGSIDVPGSSVTINASEEDPAALITVYQESDDGWEASDVKVGHRVSTLKKIPALRFMEGKRYHRSEATQFDAVEDRIYEFPFSSEYPVQRYFGNEVLNHDAQAADLSRLNDGAPLLFNHDPDKVIGVVERAYIDDKKRRGYARVRFSRNAFAQEILSDVKDGILRNVSFGYSIDKMEERSGDFIATAWSPFEVSLVSIPADPGVGIGRSLEAKQAAPAAPNPDPISEMENATPDLAVVRAEAAEAERSRIAGINALCDKHNMADLGRQLIESGRSIDEARAAVLEQISAKPMEQIKTADITSNDVGLSDKETRSFSFARALNYLANPSDANARRAAEFEIEVGKAAAQKYERSSNGIVIPNEVLRRDLVVGTPTAGGNLVADELLAGSFIDLLRNRLALAQAGVTMLTGLQGNISIPRQTSAATAYWVGENTSPTESQQAIDQVNMTPKTVGAYVDYSRRLLLQSSIDVEGMIRSDLARVIALELDRAAIYGTGSSNQPLGLANTTGIGSQTITSFGTFAEYIGMETDVAAANADAGSLRYIINASARGALKSTEKAANTGMFVFEDGEINGYPAIVSNQLQNNDALFGDFSMLIMGMWSGLDLTVDPYAGATAGTVRVIALQDVDVAVKQPSAFCLGT